MPGYMYASDVRECIEKVIEECDLEIDLDETMHELIALLNEQAAIAVEDYLDQYHEFSPTVEDIDAFSNWCDELVWEVAGWLDERDLLRDSDGRRRKNVERVMLEYIYGVVVGLLPEKDEEEELRERMEEMRVHRINYGIEEMFLAGRFDRILNKAIQPLEPSFWTTIEIDTPVLARLQRDVNSPWSGWSGFTHNRDPEVRLEAAMSTEFLFEIKAYYGLLIDEVLAAIVRKVRAIPEVRQLDGSKEEITNALRKILPDAIKRADLSRPIQTLTREQIDLIFGEEPITPAEPELKP